VTLEAESLVHVLLALLRGHGISEGFEVYAVRVCRWLTTVTTIVASTSTSVSTSTTIALPYLRGPNKGVNKVALLSGLSRRASCKSHITEFRGICHDIIQEILELHQSEAITPLSSV
jgi:hypothetical protein